MSDNPVAQGKTLGRALPNVPFQSVVLADADQERAQEYVRKKLEALQLATPAPAPDTPGYSPAVRSAQLDQATVRSIDVLGGRMQDLEALTEKLGLGQSVPDAGASFIVFTTHCRRLAAQAAPLLFRPTVEEIVTRTVVELRKNAFGDDLEDAKSLPWKRGQAWTIVEQLSKSDEVSPAQLAPCCTPRDVLLKAPSFFAAGILRTVARRFERRRSCGESFGASGDHLCQTCRW